MGKMVYKILAGKSEGKRLFKDLHVDRRIPINWFLDKWGRGCGLDLSGAG
jgi:hypothetical protein